MPIHDLGYRSWEGATTPPSTRWWVLAQSGISLAWKGRWLRRMLFFAWLPALYFGSAFFLYEYVAERVSGSSPAELKGAERFLRNQVGVPAHILEEALEDPRAARSSVWSYLIFLFFRAPQAVLMVLLVGLIAPPLISRDVRSRAFLLYFSRPITRSEYLVGKGATVWFFAIMITTLPALALYLLALLLSENLAVFADTWHIPLRILAASAVLMIPTAALALCFSSLTTESRYAAFGWFAIWVLGWVGYRSLTSRADPQEWMFLSFFHTLGRVQGWIYGVEVYSREIVLSIVLLGAVTVVSVVVLYRRISAPMRV